MYFYFVSSYYYSIPIKCCLTLHSLTYSLTTDSFPHKVLWLVRGGAAVSVVEMFSGKKTKTNKKWNTRCCPNFTRLFLMRSLSNREKR